MKLLRLRHIAGAGLLLAGLLLFTYWTPDIPQKMLVAKYATGASDFIALPSGATAHYRMQGNDEGPTVLLIHGSNASLHTWEGWVDQLEEDYFVVTIDLPGHGLTGATPSEDYTYSGMVSFLKEFTNSVGLKSFFIAGNSMGGAVSLQYSLTFSEEVLGLILVDSAGIKTPEIATHKTDHPLAFRLAGNWYSGWVLENITPRSVAAEGLSKSMFDQTYLTEALIDRYWELALHPGNRSATNKRFAWYRSSRQELAVENISVPTLIIWGEEDVVIPVETAHELHKRIKGSQIVTHKGLGHIPMEENPRKTIKEAKNFLAAILAKN